MYDKTRKRLLKQCKIVVDAFDNIYSLIESKCIKGNENPRTVNGIDYEYHSLATELPEICRSVLIKFIPKFTELDYIRFFRIAEDQEPNFRDELKTEDNILYPIDGDDLSWREFQRKYGK